MSQRGYDPALDGSLENYYTNVNPMAGQAFGMAQAPRPQLGVPYGGRSNYRDRFQPTNDVSQYRGRTSSGNNLRPSFKIADLFKELGGGNLQRSDGGFGGGLQDLFGRIGQQTGQMRDQGPPNIYETNQGPERFERRGNNPPQMPQDQKSGFEGLDQAYINRSMQQQMRIGNNPPQMQQRGQLPQEQIGYSPYPMPSPMPFPSPGRKGQRNIPQPGGYYPQPPSSPSYPGGGFPSPGRKGNRYGYQRPSYQQPRMPYGYGQMQNNSYRFGNSGIPQNIYGFQNPHYQPYQPPSYSPTPYDPGGQPGGPSDDGRVDDGYYQNPPMTGGGGMIRTNDFQDSNMNGIDDRDEGGFGGGTTTNPGGKGGSMNNSIPFVPPYVTNNDFNEQPLGGGYAGGFNQQQPVMGGGFGGGGGKGMNGGGRTAFPRSDVLSSYMNR